MSISCPQCAAQMPDDAAFCPACGRAMPAAARAQGTVGAFPENIAGALAYVTFIPAIIFLLVDPYRTNRFVRFHSLQCLFGYLALFLVGAVLRIAGVVLYIIPVLGHLLIFLVSVVVGLAAFVIWLVLVIKALQGEEFKVPIIGDLAERQAAAGRL
jgi:uncharacterized membrane protein